MTSILIPPQSAWFIFSSVLIYQTLYVVSWIQECLQYDQLKCKSGKQIASLCISETVTMSSLDSKNDESSDQKFRGKRRWSPRRIFLSNPPSPVYDKSISFSRFLSDSEFRRRCNRPYSFSWTRVIHKRSTRCERTVAIVKACILYYRA